MRQNDDGKTVAAMEFAPGIGNSGGTKRRRDCGKNEEMITEEEWWYDTDVWYGSMRFWLGFEDGIC